MSAPNTNVPAPGNPVLQSYNAWAERTPFITRNSMVFLVIIYFITFFVSLESYLGDIPFYTILRFELYRLLLSPLVGNSIFTVLLVVLTYPTLGVKMEASMGSSAFLSLLFILTSVVNVFFNAFCLMFYILGASDALGWACMDFWTLLFALITIDCLQTPDAPRRLLCVPYDVPSKYIPLLLYALICLFSGFALSYAVSLLVGFLWMRGYLDRLRPSSQYLQTLEAEGGLLHRPSRSSGWVLAATLGHDAWIPLNTVDPSEHDGQQPSAPPMWNSTTTNANTSDDSHNNPFPGAGRKLTATTTATPTAETAGGYFSLPLATASYAPTIAAPPVSAPSREEVAARRLAALQQQGITSHNPVHSVNSQTNNNNNHNNV